MRPGICNSCGAEVVWIDIADRPRSHICEKGHKVGYTEDGRLVKIHESHFAHCPNAAQHRKAKTS